jgi:hypothetical protein
MTFLRKWRFPILIGSGLIAAGVLVYFANTHVGADKTQGAIGKRDVYRDAQDNSADVATPGSAPVATEAILQSSDYKELAKNPAFQELLRESSFNKLAREKAFFELLSDNSFRVMSQNRLFLEFVRTDLFQQAVRQGTLASLRPQEAKYQDLIRLDAYNRLINNAAFQSAARNQSFAGLVSSNAFQLNMEQRAFTNLVSQAGFQGILVNNASAIGGHGDGR